MSNARKSAMEKELAEDTVQTPCFGALGLCTATIRHTCRRTYIRHLEIMLNFFNWA